MLGFFAVKIVGILMAVFAGNYTIFVIGRFLIGGGQVGYFLPGFVLGNAYHFFPFDFDVCGVACAAVTVYWVRGIRPNC